MELDDLKYKNRQNDGDSSSTILSLSGDVVKKITEQKSTSLLDRIDENLKRNIQYQYLFILIGIGILVYNYDLFFAYYLFFGFLMEAELMYTTYKLRKSIYQNYEADLPLSERFTRIQALIIAYLKFRKSAAIIRYIILVIAFSLNDIQSFNVASVFSGTVLFNLIVIGIIFYFIHTYYFKKFVKPHQDMLVDLRYYLAELKESSEAGSKDSLEAKDAD
ncbi:hypothetical protein [Sphingobacterium sp. SYP-B4668]|uniref:hypothetical protein n=1 Tax=Sphingobacterium sp. SYP-B4668 TaxID=2996035 RepID=UPI0022DCF252|nr:hypothetical protein [Sphingobacterium sp. SYP-B4668]